MGEDNIDNKQEKVTLIRGEANTGLTHVGWKTRRLVSLWRVATSATIPVPMILAAVLFVVIGCQ